MKIKIKDKMFVESDGTQFIIKQYSGNFTTNKKGEEIEGYRVLGYYGTIEQVLNGLIDKEIHESNATTFKELIEDIKRIKTDIESLIKNG